MGVDGGSTHFISFAPKELQLRQNKFKYIVIDTYSLICRYVIGSFKSKTYICNKSNKPIAEIYFLFVVALRFLENGLVPIFVFDGASPEIKYDTLQKRRDAKIKADEKHKEAYETLEPTPEPTLESEIDIDEEDSDRKDTDDDKIDTSNELDLELDRYIKYLKNSFRLNTANIELAKLLLRWMGLPVVNAREEADPQCAAIATQYPESVIGVLTDDFDTLMYKSVNIIKLPNLGSNILHEYSLDQTLEHVKKKIAQVIKTESEYKIGAVDSQDEKNRERQIYMAKIKKLKFTHQNLVDLGCLMGTDFCPGLKVKRTYNSSGMVEKRFDTILKIYINNDMSLENVLKSLSGTISKQYVERMKAAKDVYSTAKIYDPKEMKINFDKPNLNMIKKICTDIGLISDSDLEIALNLIQTAFNRYESDQKFTDVPKPSHHPTRMSGDNTTGKRLIDYNDHEKFSSFASYRAKHVRQNSLKTGSESGIGYSGYMHNSMYGHRFVHNRQFPEPLTRIPIKVPCKP
jgi:5'-3' exonuclease